MILDEIGHHLNPAQALAAIWLFAGYFAGQAVRVSAELAWCALTGRDLRPCGCRHCVSVHAAANRTTNSDDATIVPPARELVAV